MQPNVIVAEAIGPRARFAWLGIALAATIALLVSSALAREGARARERERMRRAERAELFERSLHGHHCGVLRWPAHATAERAERHVLRTMERAERRALRAMERAERSAE